MKQRLEITVITEFDLEKSPDQSETEKWIIDAFKDDIKLRLGTPKKNTHVLFQYGEPE